MTSWPISWLGISFSPDASSWRTMPLTMRSSRSSSTGRLRMAMRMERASLSRPNGTRRPRGFSAAAVGLQDGELTELDAFDGGEALAAIAAQAPAADGGAIVGRAAVFDLGV